jgi:hypothetical protein
MILDWLKPVGIGVIGAVLAAHPANAASQMKISASGFWGANAPSTAYSEPGKAFFFSFQMPSTYTYVDYGDVKVVDPSEIRNLQYSLGGVPLSVSISAKSPPDCVGGAGLLCDVEIVDSAGGGGLTLDFADASVDFFGVDNVDIGSGGKLRRGGYAFFPNINGDPSGTNGQLNEGDGPMTASVTPEPEAWALMLVGVAVVGGGLRRRRRVAVTA